jgi:Tol biopolymer transport system component
MMNHKTATALVALSLLASACATTGGSEVELSDEDRSAMKSVGTKAKGMIVWSSARVANHDLFVMNTDGSDVRQITQGENVDWFPRFSPDGGKVLFVRSKKGWVYERDANSDGKWDLWTVSVEGKDESKVVENASWGNWIDGEEIIYVRGTKILRKKLGDDKETLVMDSEGVSDLDGALLQQPQLSKDGKFIAITLRGSKRETGVWDIARKKWTKTGLGCQINWTPDGSHIYWVNPTGNGGSEVFSVPMKNGKPAKADLSDDEQKFMDLPGRRSHEYFPQLSADGKFMVWAATQRGHDHDTADYEVYIWEVGAGQDKAARLTFHSANDRWPDIFIPGAGGGAAASAGAGASGGGGGAAAALEKEVGAEPAETAGAEAGAGVAAGGTEVADEDLAGLTGGSGATKKKASKATAKKKRKVAKKGKRR